MEAKRKVLTLTHLGGREVRFYAKDWKNHGRFFIGYGGTWGGEVVSFIEMREEYIAYQIDDETEDDQFIDKLCGMNAEDFEKVKNFCKASGIIQ